MYHFKYEKNAKNEISSGIKLQPSNEEEKNVSVSEVCYCANQRFSDSNFDGGYDTQNFWRITFTDKEKAQSFKQKLTICIQPYLDQENHKVGETFSLSNYNRAAIYTIRRLPVFIAAFGILASNTSEYGIPLEKLGEFSKKTYGESRSAFARNIDSSLQECLEIPQGSEPGILQQGKNYHWKLSSILERQKDTPPTTPPPMTHLYVSLFSHSQTTIRTDTDEHEQTDNNTALLKTHFETFLAGKGLLSDQDKISVRRPARGTTFIEFELSTENNNEEQLEKIRAIRDALNKSFQDHIAPDQPYFCKILLEDLLHLLPMPSISIHILGWNGEDLCKRLCPPSQDEAKTARAKVSPF